MSVCVRTMQSPCCKLRINKAVSYSEQMVTQTAEKYGEEENTFVSY